MTLLDLYSRRKRKANGETVDVWTYANIPSYVRIQIKRALVVRIERLARADKAYEFIVHALRDELGKNRLLDKYFENKKAEFESWFDQNGTVDRTLDAVEIALMVINHFYAQDRYTSEENLARLDDTVDVINARLREAAIGYALHKYKFIKIADEHLHEQAVLPALEILGDPNFSTVNEEYRSAFDHYKAGSFEESLTDCGKALESMFKIIGDKLSWGLDPKDTLARLISTAVETGFIPDFMIENFTGLRGNLQAVGTIRNKSGGHGKGSTPRAVPQHLVEYQLHMTASAIVFLHKSYQTASQ